jgi:hypothetical protein
MPPAAHSLPVRELVLYKHGVGFFARRGPFEGDELALTFRADEINDVLKSLAVFDRAGGGVLGVHYATPMDRPDRLAQTSINLSDAASLRDLLRDLRGRRITCTFESETGATEQASGRVVGLDQPSANQVDTLPHARVSLLLDDGAVRAFPYTALRGLTLDDPQAAQDLRYFLDTSLDEDARRTVTLRLSAGAHDLAIYYVAPTPTWRVSYRVVAEPDAEAEGGTGRASLQGWGVFDNRLDEDLAEVRVTLVAGQPISFIYDLYSSHIPQRPVIHDEARLVERPPEFRGAAKAVARKEAESRFRRMGAGDALAVMKLASPAPTAGSLELAYSDRADADDETPDWLSAPAAQAEGVDAGETFQYVVTTPVTVKRGESALVPIIGGEVRTTRELLYNGAKVPHHPVAALRFSNTTGLTLERGPATVVEGGDYKGEAIIPFTKAGGEVYVPFAVELGVRVAEATEVRQELFRLHIKDAVLVSQHYHIVRTTYTIENSTTRDLTVTVEAAINPHLTLTEATPPPDAETLTERRWAVAAPAGQKTPFVVEGRRGIEQQEYVRNLSYARLAEFLRENLLSRALHDALAEVLNEVAKAQKANANRRNLEAEREAQYKAQEQVRGNLGALKGEGREGALRERLLTQFEAAQDRIERLNAEIARLTDEIAVAEAQIETLIAGLNEQPA